MGIIFIAIIINKNIKNIIIINTFFYFISFSSSQAHQIFKQPKDLYYFSLIIYYYLSSIAVIIENNINKFLQLKFNFLLRILQYFSFD